ncbi:TetR/AcrR family transcriptional regulator [Saccharopolyspora phatthalungensis]|uniref:AcrR family transcriptional regulator n=1 Tax=Saccharopolyspora phatthalungensis TaxID=664693 RepID=A0A840QFJ9_9PSEU|nr:TetR/AcrR family transcriptional regulator [Saccharopolyspora phatthalungensis]MBB5155873.1 AcrR family transcriptional regulator [Saccharopolyspora phatthalungensis]
MSTHRPYHHGDLRQTLLDTSVEMIAEHGLARLSLRDLARRAGVSHAAPRHHFRDKAGLFTALATEGYRLLADALAGDLGLIEMGARYVGFALEHPCHFEVMHQPDRCHPDDPDLFAAKARSWDALRAGLPAELDSGEAERAALAAWSIAHGFATLRLAGNLPTPAQDRDPAEAFREIAGLLNVHPD